MRPFRTSSRPCIKQKKMNITLVSIYKRVQNWYVGAVEVNEINQFIKEDPMFYKYRKKGRTHG